MESINFSHRFQFLTFFSFSLIISREKYSIRGKDHAEKPNVGCLVLKYEKIIKK
jgi:hypothetical protein